MNFLKKFFIILIIIFISITFIDCISVSRKLSEIGKEKGADTSKLDKSIDELEKSLENLTDSLVIDTVEEAEEKEETKEIIPDFYVHQSIIAEDTFEITIHGVENYEEENDFAKPDKGFRYVAIDIEIKNLSNSILELDLFNGFKLQDSDNYIYGISIGWKLKKPHFSYEDLEIGQIRRGWETFEVKEDAIIKKIIVKPIEDTFKDYKIPSINIKFITPLKP